MPVETSPAKEPTQMLTAPSRSSAKGAAPTAAGATGPGKDPTLQASISAETGPGKEPTLYAMISGDTAPAKEPARIDTAFGPGGCGCGCGCGQRPFGVPEEERARPPSAARRALVEQLLRDLAALLKRLNAALLTGELTAQDRAQLHALQEWYACLLAEQGGPRRPR